jgi:hypothetical protein
MGNKKELQRLCSRNDVPIETSKMGIVEGWEGKAKGMLQMLFEHGRINPTGMSEYTVNGRNDAFGNLTAETSLRHLMEQLGDFQDEESLMQYHGRRLGVTEHQSVILKWQGKELSTIGQQQKGIIACQYLKKYQKQNFVSKYQDVLTVGRYSPWRDSGCLADVLANTWWPIMQLTINKKTNKRIWMRRRIVCSTEIHSNSLQYS